uniref:Retrovirus-related Pol polyprotein from transposon TNT 1-94 n=1 Tax=Tanacetum cinerariifolium TaxID=118510 RepID=A0A699HTS3_TANCI|nr:hypothetical protein [Tanacetum cinerariifolium]
MILYIRVKENGKLHVDSVLNGPFKYGTVTITETLTTPATVRDRTYDELANAEKIRSAKVIHCCNYQEEGHVTRQCTEPKRLRNSTWFKEKAMLAEALESGVALDKEHMEFLADNEDTVTTSSVVLMAKLSAYDSNVLLEVPTHENYLDNQVNNRIVQEMQYYEQPHFDNEIDVNITSDTNIISYEKYLNENKNQVVQNTNSSAQQEVMIMSVIKEMSNQVAQRNEETLEMAELSRLKMHAKRNNKIAKEKKVNIAPIDYVALKKLSEHFVKHFVPQKQLSA